MAVLGVETGRSSPSNLSENAAAFSIESLLSATISRTNNNTTPLHLNAKHFLHRQISCQVTPEINEHSVQNASILRNISPELPIKRNFASSSSGKGLRIQEDINSMKDVNCKLETSDLWKKFHDLGTEMIITKTGRRMFPTLRVSFNGLNDNSHYDVYMDIIPVDCKRYRYAYHRSSWLVAGKGDPAQSTRPHRHHDSPCSGSALSRQTISFEKIKLTNNNIHKNDHVVLNSMHKYRPRIHIVRRNSPDDVIDDWSGCEISEIFKHCAHKSFVFDETTFIAVTAYQNQLITKLKIDSNPFAKGFRDSSRLSDMERETMEGMLHGLPKSSYLELHAQLAAAAKFVNSQPVSQNLQTTPMFPVPHNHRMISYPSIIPRSKFDDVGLRANRWNEREPVYPKQAKSTSTIRFKPYETR